MSTQEEEEDSDKEINPLTMLLLQDDDDDDDDDKEEDKLTITPTQQQQQEEYYEIYHLDSIKARVEIRLLPSQGLSFQLWPAANTLVSLLHSPTPLSPLLLRHSPRLRILEIGSGTGLVGIAAAATLGAHVTLTDLPHVLPNLHFNAQANANAVRVKGGSVDVAALGWGDKEAMEGVGGEYDIIMGSDVVYHDHLYEPLLETLRFFLLGKKVGAFVMSHLKRWKKESLFFKKANKYFDVQVLHRDVPCNGSRVGVIVYSFVGKKTKTKTATPATPEFHHITPT